MTQNLLPVVMIQILEVGCSVIPDVVVHS